MSAGTRSATADSGWARWRSGPGHGSAGGGMAPLPLFLGRGGAAVRRCGPPRGALWFAGAPLASPVARPGGLVVPRARRASPVYRAVAAGTGPRRIGDGEHGLPPGVEVPDGP